MIRLYVVCYSAKKNETKLCYKQATAWMNLKSRKLSEGSQRTEDAEGNMGHTVAKWFPGQLAVLFLMSVCAEQVGLTPSPLTLVFV